MIKVYIAGPYTDGDTIINVRAAIDAANQLVKFNCAPFIPHLYHFWHFVYPHNYHTWIKMDMEWLKQCDIVLRLSGVSNGATKEVELAKQLGKPVYTSLAELCDILQRSDDK